MLADVLCSKPGTLHSSLGVRLMLLRPAEQGKWAGVMLHCSVDCIVKSAQSRHRRRPGHVFSSVVSAADAGSSTGHDGPPD